jgi:hypothetical protein
VGREEEEAKGQDERDWNGGRVANIWAGRRVIGAVEKYMHVWGGRLAEMMQCTMCTVCRTDGRRGSKECVKMWWMCRGLEYRCIGVWSRRVGCL